MVSFASETRGGACVTTLALVALSGAACTRATIQESVGSVARVGTGAPPSAIAVSSAPPSDAATKSMQYAPVDLAAGDGVKVTFGDETYTLSEGTATTRSDRLDVELRSKEEARVAAWDPLAGSHEQVAARLVVSFTLPLPNLDAHRSDADVTFVSGMAIATELSVRVLEPRRSAAKPATEPLVGASYETASVDRLDVRVRVAWSKGKLVVRLDSDGPLVNARSSAKVSAHGALAVHTKDEAGNAALEVVVPKTVSAGPVTLTGAKVRVVLLYALLEDTVLGTPRLWLSSEPIVCPPPWGEKRNGTTITLWGEGLGVRPVERVRDILATPQPVTASTEEATPDSPLWSLSSRNTMAPETRPRGWIAFDAVDAKRGGAVRGSVSLAAPRPLFEAKRPADGEVTLQGTFVGTVCHDASVDAKPP